MKTKELTKSHPQWRGDILYVYFKECYCVRHIFFNPSPPHTPCPPPPTPLSLWHPTGNITPHSTQMGSPHTSHAHIQSCVQIYTNACAYKHDHNHPNQELRETYIAHARTHTPSNPGHQLQWENQVISISLITRHHISSCSPFEHNLSSSPIKPINSDPTQNNPPPPHPPLRHYDKPITTSAIDPRHDSSLYCFVLVSPHPLKSPQTPTHNAVFNYKNK